ncbi:MAG: DUF5939 domain-containing protein, partial [Polyangiaceae bacterium]
MSEATLAASPPSLGAFLARHPWPEEALRQGRPLDCLWHFEVAARPEELWPFVSDTSRMNQAMGVSRMHFEERDGRLEGSSVNAGVEQRWVEVPWVWVAEREIESTRLYSRGFARVGRGIFELTPVGDDRSRFDVYFGWIPRGPISRLILRIGMADLARQFGRRLAAVEGEVRSGRDAPEPLRPSRLPLSPDGLARLESLGARLIKQGADRAVVEKLVTYVKTADDTELYRIQIRPLARRWQIPEDALLSVCLRATRVGLLELSWDVICPHCRGVRSEVRMLGEVPAKDGCQACGIDFDTGGDNAVEITFHVHPSIREVERVFYCSAEPAKKKHIQVQIDVPPGGERAVTTSLRAGSYRLRARPVSAQAQVTRGDVDRGALLEVTAEATDEALDWAATRTPRDARVRPMPRLVLKNDDAEPVRFVVEGRSWSDEALRPERLLSFYEFRDLFSEA